MPSFVLRQWRHTLQNSLFFRPLFILVGHLVLAWCVLALDAPLSRWLIPTSLHLEPGVALTLLATIAASVMTVVSVVYSILLVALSLTSMQFSTRVVAGYVRDPLSQTVAGVFVGTFLYCLVVMLAIRTDVPRAPVVPLGVAVLLTVSCLGLLLTFIQHMTRSIRANTLVDRIAREARTVIEAVFVEHPQAERAELPDVSGGTTVRARSSGYVQIVDIDTLRARARGRAIRLLRPMGSFVPEGGRLFHVDAELPADECAELVDCVELGEERTLQDDAEYGFRQLVDVALKAISPAVNDPSTAATCIDQLSGLLIAAGTRPDPPTVFQGPEGGRLEVMNTCFEDLVDLAVEQIRQFGKADMAVCLRLIRMLTDVREAVGPDRAARVIDKQIGFVERAARRNFSEDDCEELDRRLQRYREVAAKN